MAASRSLPFDQVEKLAHEIDTVEEMEAAVEDPEALLKRAADLAIEALLPKLLDTVRPMAASRSLPFDQVEKLAHEIDTVEEMEAAVEDPEALLKRAADLAIEALLPKLLDTVRPWLRLVRCHSTRWRSWRTRSTQWRRWRRRWRIRRHS